MVDITMHFNIGNTGNEIEGRFLSILNPGQNGFS